MKTPNQLQKMGTAQLITFLSKEKFSPEEKEIALLILKKRGQDTSKWTNESLEEKVIVVDDTLSPEELRQVEVAEKAFDKVSLPKVKRTNPSKPKINNPSVSKTKINKDLPKEGSISEKILNLLKEGKSKYTISKELETYYSAVDRVAKRYLC